jgi:hypothetical protein
MYETYEEPTIEFITKRLNQIPFGMLKAGEMETLLFFVLLYKNGDLDKNEFVLADKYLLTETKAARLKIDIAKRFAAQSGAEYAAAFFRAVEDKTIELEWDKTAHKISLPIFDPNCLRAFKQILAENQIPYDKGNNGSLLKLSELSFITLYLKCGENAVKENIKPLLKRQFDTADYKKVFTNGTPLPEKIKTILLEHTGDILAAISLVVPLLSRP